MSEHDPDHKRCNETVSPGTRADVLARDRHRCRNCGALGPEEGGSAILHAHHLDRDPDELDMHAMENLTTLCRQCHSWLHNQPSVAELPVALSDDAASEVLPHGREILVVLGESGPLTTGEIRTEVSADVSVMTVRERCWNLMGLDAHVASQDRQVMDQDATTGEWGLPEQIAQSARGRIPDSPELVVQRAADERVRRALEAGIDRDVVADIFGVTARTTYHQQKRARAYQFPLDVLDGRHGGRPPTSDSQPGNGVPDTPGGDDAQQRLTTVTDGAGEDRADDSGEGDEGDEGDDEPLAGNDEVRTRLREAIAALQAVDNAL
jgi:hypothetical protein